MAKGLNLAGQRIGDYTILRLLDRGGMAEVYLARHEHLRREDVLKVLLPRYAERDVFVERFRRDAQAISSLHHPHIVQVYGWGKTADDRPYIAMQYARAGTLADKLETARQKSARLSIAYTLAIMRQIASALVAAHDQQIVHRDLKPSNILLETENKALLTDLGIALLLNDPRLTASQEVLGTPEYMSPEQARSAAVDGRSDIFSMGVILYEMLSGRRPFAADTPVSALLKVVSEEPPPLGTLRPDLRPQTVALVETCLRKNPASRYRSARELLSAIEGVMAAEGARPAGAEGAWLLEQGKEARVYYSDRDRGARTPTPSGSASSPLKILGYASLAVAALVILFALFSRNSQTDLVTSTPGPVTSVVVTGEETPGVIIFGPEGSGTALPPTSTLAAMGDADTDANPEIEASPEAAGTESPIAGQDLIATPTLHPGLEPVGDPEARVIGNPAYFSGPGTDFTPIDRFEDSELVEVIASDDNGFWYLVRGLAGTPVWLPADSVAWSNPGPTPEIPVAATLLAPQPTVAKPTTAIQAITPLPETPRLIIELLQPLCGVHGTYPENGEVDFVWRIRSGSAVGLNLGVSVTPGSKILTSPLLNSSGNPQIKLSVGRFDIGVNDYTWQVVLLDDNGKVLDSFGENGCINLFRRPGGTSDAVDDEENPDPPPPGGIDGFDPG